MVSTSKAVRAPDNQAPTTITAATTTPASDPQADDGTNTSATGARDRCGDAHGIGVTGETRRPPERDPRLAVEPRDVDRSLEDRRRRRHRRADDERPEVVARRPAGSALPVVATGAEQMVEPQRRHQLDERRRDDRQDHVGTDGWQTEIAEGEYRPCDSDARRPPRDGRTPRRWRLPACPRCSADQHAGEGRQQREAVSAAACTAGEVGQARGDEREQQDDAGGGGGRQLRGRSAGDERSEQDPDQRGHVDEGPQAGRHQQQHRRDDEAARQGEHHSALRATTT